MTISVMQSDTKVTIVIECKDSTEAEKVAAEMNTEVNTGKFLPKAMAPSKSDDEPDKADKPAKKAKKDD
jgi:hypothetical protein